MALFGLIKDNAKYVDEVDTNKTEITQESKEDFFLEPDDAQTLGDIDYMRKAKKVKRTFPNTSKGKGAEIVREVSSLDETITKNNQIQKSTTAIPSTKSFSVEKVEKIETKPEMKEIVKNSPSTDNSMDMFLKMARNIKK